MKRVVWGTVLLAAALSLPGSARAECSTIIATTPGGATFPCTVCVENGRPTSAVCTPAPTGR